MNLGKHLNKIYENKEFTCGIDIAFTLNDCKYLYDMYRRYSMLILVLLLICFSIIIIMYYVWLTK